MKKVSKAIINFDDYVERKNTDSRKWSMAGMHEMATYVDDNSIPLWVADMDYKVPTIIIEKLKKRVEHGVFGYSIPSEEYYNSIKYWNKIRNNWEIEKEWIVSTPGVVVGLNFAIKAFTAIGDGIIIQNPVYPPFKSSILNNNRVIVDNSLIDKNGLYFIDFEDLEKKASNPKNKLMIICNPHNPIGKVWTKEDLEKIGEICFRNNVILISDEIHSDLILFGNKFTTIGILNENIINNSIICTSPSKTFNIAGIPVSNIIISNEKLRMEYLNEIIKSGLKPIPSLFGAIAVESCYTLDGLEWLEEVKRNLENNYIYLKDYLKENIPKITCGHLEGTYLAWLDFKKLGYSNQVLNEKLEKEAKLVIDPGEIFGEMGTGFIRLNFACHKKILIETLERLKIVFGK